MKHSNYNESKYELQHEEGGLSIILKPVVRSGYQYKYNGKEYQDELGLNLYDMDFRDYDPAIARWTGIDPVVHHGMSTYMAFDGNLVFWADPSGADSQTIYGFDGTGYSIGDNDLTTVWQAGNINDDSSLEDVLGRYFPSTIRKGIIMEVLGE